MHRTRLVLTAICAAATALAIAGCGSSAPPDPIDRLQAIVTESVGEPDRRARMLRSIAGMRDVLDRYDTESRRAAETLRALTGEHDATRTRFDAVYAKAERDRIAARTAYLDHLFTLRAVATDDEWARLYDTQMQVHAARLIVQNPEAAR